MGVQINELPAAASAQSDHEIPAQRGGQTVKLTVSQLLLDGSVSTAKIANGALSADTPGRAKMADGFVTSAKIADSAITSAKIADGTIVNADLANMAQATVKGRAAAAGTGVPADLTATELLAVIATAPAYNKWTHIALDDLSAVSEWSRNNLGSFRALRLSGFIFPSVSNVFRFQISSNNGSSWLSGASDHTVSYQGYTGAARADGVTTGNAGWITIIASGVNRRKSFGMTLNSWNLAQEKTSINVEGGATASAHSTAQFSNLMTGGCAVAANAIKIFAASGNISGEILLEGLSS